LLAAIRCDDLLVTSAEVISTARDRPAVAVVKEGNSALRCGCSTVPPGSPLRTPASVRERIARGALGRLAKGSVPERDIR
jgi:hypothetical protein